MAQGGTLGDLRNQDEQWTGNLMAGMVRQGITFELRNDGGSFYDPESRKMVLDAYSSPADQARAIVFEARRLKIDTQKNEIAKELGRKEYQKIDYRTDGHADPALRDKFQPRNRNEYVSDKLATAASAATMRSKSPARFEPPA
jgi:hypothetical protein